MDNPRCRGAVDRTTTVSQSRVLDSARGIMELEKVEKSRGKAKKRREKGSREQILEFPAFSLFPGTYQFQGKGQFSRGGISSFEVAFGRLKKSCPFAKPTTADFALYKAQKHDLLTNFIGNGEKTADERFRRGGNDGGREKEPRNFTGTGGKRRNGPYYRIMTIPYLFLAEKG